MNAKTIVLIAAFIASGNVFAERMGRDSVYAKAGPSTTVPAKFPVFGGNGRGSVYASSDRSVGTPLKGPAVAGNGRNSVYAKDFAQRDVRTTRQADLGTRHGRS